MVRIVGIVAGAMVFFMLIYAYFGSHFYFGSVVANVAVGGLSVQAAEEKIQQETKQVEIKLKGSIKQSNFKSLRRIRFKRII